MKRRRRPFNLELAQRDLHGILIDKPMEFSEATLAKSLRQMVECYDFGSDGFFLRALADALDHPDSEWELTLKRTDGKGEFVPPDQRVAKFTRDALVHWHVERRLAEGWRKEPAVVDAGERFGLGRSAVYGCIKRSEEWASYISATIDGKESTHKRSTRDRYTLQKKG